LFADVPVRSDAVLDAICTLYAYNAWANDRVLEAAARLPAEQFVAAVNGGDSVRDTLVHTAAAQWVYLRRWQGTSPRSLWQAADYLDVATLRARWAEIEGETQEYLAALTEDDLERVVAYVNFQGERWAYPLWQMLLHQVNHATQHRSEAAMMLTGFGQSPGWLDFLVYVDERAAVEDLAAGFAQ
jgi:uncharacterized damage-inducible protein DinB